MTVVACVEDFPGSAAAAERIWQDIGRWRDFVEGFESVKRIDEHWPAVGSRLTWSSVPHGRGEVKERVIEHVPAERSVSEITDDGMQATRRVSFLDMHDQLTVRPGRVRVTFELDYRLSGSLLRHLAIDRLFVRRAVRDSIRRELERFGSELRAG